MASSVINWKKNLVAIWFTQFFAIMAFSFSLPFVPYYLQEDLGVTGDKELKFFIAIFGAAAPAAFAVFGPIWGAAADRYGRRLMMLRANIATFFVIGGMGLVSNAWGLIFFRLMQGCLTGTVTASQTMVAVHTPKERGGTAFGALSAALFSGGLCGNTLGGFFAEWFGYRQAFYAGACLSGLSVLIIALFVRDNFDPPLRRTLTPRKRAKLTWLTLWPSLPLLGLMCYITLSRLFGLSLLALLVQQLNGGTEGASKIMGLLGGVSGIAGFFSGMVMGWVADRVIPLKILIVCALVAGLMTFGYAIAWGFLPLFIFRFIAMFFAGGIDPVFQNILAKSTVGKRKGVIFGWAASAKAVGWMLAPLLAGALAMLLNVRFVFVFGAVLFILQIPVAYWVLVKKATRSRLNEPRISFKYSNT